MSEKKLTETGIIGADTTFLVDFFSGEPKAAKFMRDNARLIKVSTLIIYEFLCGNLNEAEKKIFFDAMQSFTTAGFSIESAVIAGNLYRNVKKAGKTTGHQDCMIAGSYMSSGIKKIVTRNTEHFKNLKGVEVISY